MDLGSWGVSCESCESNHSSSHGYTAYTHEVVLVKFTPFGKLCYNPKLRAKEERKLAAGYPGSDVLQENTLSIATAPQPTPRFARQSPFPQFSFGKKTASLPRTVNTRVQSVTSGTSSFVVYERPETEFSPYPHSESTTNILDTVTVRMTSHTPVQYRSAVTPQSLNFFSTSQSPATTRTSAQNHGVWERQAL
jgi:hypothetical protein